jgi:hypothetical protein
MTTNIVFSEESSKLAFVNYYHFFSDILRPLYNYIRTNNFNEALILIYFRCEPTAFAKDKLEELGWDPLSMPLDKNLRWIIVQLSKIKVI